MSREIERKFLLKDDSWKSRSGTEYLYCSQAYFSLAEPEKGCVRVRIMGEKAFLTIKGPTEGFTRSEFEYEIPCQDAKEMMTLPAVTSRLEKKRYFVREGGFLWEIDEFLGENAPLVLAEIELPCEDTSFSLPSFIGKEVTGDKRYYNGFLTRNPYQNWKDEI